ncbi:cytochrome b [Stakelama tenebrarum]|uniref:Cytochrome b n=1 Tax=Stakelama tenebrarum TaxID=2711215 RepID=A0A6G6Y8H9_9SPHN|nr:cytochrome b [Sphingosinithalassobacter tenebrarum]QIG81107.1 cytochrome b [Sphingosinithalassobacter tenebrarum]
MATTDADRYDRVAIALHWLVAALVIINLVLGLFHESLFDARQVIPLHKSIGMTVLLLSIARVVWRLGHRAPALPAQMPGWEKASAHATHLALYGLILLLPLTGWMMSSNPERPRPVGWFGLFDFPVLPINEALAGFGHEAHEILGFAMLALVVLHIAAALRHQFILRDRVLSRMAR